MLNNISGLLSDNTRGNRLDIEYHSGLPQYHAMTKRILFMIAALTILAASGSAEAACYADYKAKRDNPLQLHYGVIEIPDAVCSDTAAATPEIAKILTSENWQLLRVLSVFGAAGLENRKESAGNFYLRF